MTRRIVQPALIIGTGGSGVEVLRRLRRRFREVYPNTPYVQFLGIDTAPQEPLGRDAPELGENEFMYAADFNMDFHVGRGYIDHHPEIRAWWRGYDKLPLKTIKAGAGQKRPVGRLALFVNYDRIMERLKDQVRRVFKSDVFDNLPPQYRKSVNLYVVSSTCGGTGTGQFLDLAYIAQHAIQEVRPGVSVHSRGLFFLPSAFLETRRVGAQNGPRLRANAFGALTELDYMMNPATEPAPVTYPRGERVDRADRPFRSVYLVGNQTTAGRIIDRFQEIMERAAVHMMIELASPLTETGEARMDNVLMTVAGKGPIQGRGRSYSAYGGEWLELPTARLRVRWQKRLAAELLDRLADDNGSQLEAPSRGEASSRLASLWSASGTNQFMPRVDQHRGVFTDIGEEGLETPIILGNANALQAAADKQLSAVSSEIDRLVKELTEAAIGEVRRECEETLESGSIKTRLAALDRAQNELRGWITRALQEGTSTGGGAWITSLGQLLGQIKPGLIGGKKKMADSQRQVVLEAVENAREEWQGQLRREIGRAMDRELPELTNRIREFKDLLDQADDYLLAAKALVEQEEEPAIAVGMSVGTLSDEEIDESFGEADRPERLHQEAGRHLAGLMDIRSPSVEAIKEVVWAAAGAAVREMAGEYLHRISIPSADIAHRMSELEPFAVYEPAWTANPASTEVERLRILGLPDSSTEREDEILDLMPDEVRGQTNPVFHPDPDRVVMTVQHHGFPLFALDETADLHRTLEQLDPNEKHVCFVFPEDDIRTWSFLPEGPTESRKYFGLAFVLGLIRQVGPKYVLNLGDAQSIDTPLGEGHDAESRLQAAVDQFLTGGYASDLRRVVSHRESEDTSAFFEDCTAWVAEKSIQAGDAGLPPLMDELVALVREYAESIRSF